MNDKHLDEAIDRAVRELLDVDAPADLKRRVLSELGTGARVPMRLWPLGAAASIAAAAVLAAVFVTPRDPKDAPISPPSAQAQGPLPAAQPPARMPATPPPAERRRAVTLVTAAATAEDSAHFVIAPIAALDPLAIVALESPRIDPTEVRISPLTPIDDVLVEALSTPRERE